MDNKYAVLYKKKETGPTKVIWFSSLDQAYRYMLSNQSRYSKIVKVVNVKMVEV